MRIYIDVGHGKDGEDSGCSVMSGPTKYYENDRNLKIAKVVKEVLEGYGHLVELSRTTNDNLGGYIGNYNRADSNLINSANKCNSSDYDFMISIHCNDSDNSNARGYWLTHKSDELSRKIANAIADGFDNNYKPHQHTIPKNNIDDNYSRYGILRLHNKAGVLIECGFMSNAKDLHEILCNAVGIGTCIGESINSVIPPVETFNKIELQEKINAIINMLEELKDSIK